MSILKPHNPDQRDTTYGDKKKSSATEKVVNETKEKVHKIISR